MPGWSSLTTDKTMDVLIGRTNWLIQKGSYPSTVWAGFAEAGQGSLR